MGDTKKREPSRQTSLYRKDFPGMLEKLRFQIRYKLASLERGTRQPESREQLQWAITVCDQIREHYLAAMPWPAMSLTNVMSTAWPPESVLREEFLRLEKTYDAAMARRK